MFHLGLSQFGKDYTAEKQTYGRYNYDDASYRRWVSDVALAFYTGRQDEFVYSDFERQFRHPERQQIFTINLTSEIIDECAILYSEAPIYTVRSKGSRKKHERAQKLWDEIQEKSGYLTLMDHIDKFTRLLGTVLIKVNFVDKITGMPVPVGEDGQIQLSFVENGYYDVSWVTSPYFMTELLFGFNTEFSGVKDSSLVKLMRGGYDYDHGKFLTADAVKGFHVTDDPKEIRAKKEIYWTATELAQISKDNKIVVQPNPYGIIPAVAFFNKDPLDYFFLPVDESLLYVNHGINMRLSDLNHIAKFQSFGVGVLKGAYRSNSIRQGRPQDDLNQLGGGSAMARFMGFGSSNLSNFNSTAGLGGYSDGNVAGNVVGMSIGPEGALAVGRDGDFKYEHPKADIKGLSEVIQHLADWARISHGLRPKFKSADLNQPSGMSIFADRMGVMADGVRRQKLFRAREQYFFEIIKKVWNAHHPDDKEKQFPKDVYLDVQYVEPKYPIDPNSRSQKITNEAAIIESGDRRSIKEMFPEKTDKEITKMIEDAHKDRKEQLKRNLELRKVEMDWKQENGLDFEITDTNKFTGDSSTSKTVKGATPDDLPKDSPKEKIQEKSPANNIDNKVKHSLDSSKIKNPIPKKRPNKGKAWKNKDKKK